jgi:hypothetical protein
LRKYFRLSDISIPNFKIVNNPKSPWLGKCTYDSKSPNTTTILVQKNILNDDKTRRRILLHELIHHVDFMQNKGKINRSHKGHGEFFKRWATKINSIEGPHFVSEKSDITYIEEADQEFFVLILPIKSRQFGYAWTLRPNKEQKDVIQQALLQDGRLFKTKELRWTRGAKLGKDGRFSIPALEGQKELREIYEHGKRITNI